MTLVNSILIVDDEPSICALIVDGLAETGFQCSVATNGDEAVEKISESHFDVILMDIGLPGMSGVEILRKNRQRMHTSAVTMITAQSNLELAVETMKLGACDYIVKPFTISRLLQSIRSALEGQRTLNGDTILSTSETLDAGSPGKELIQLDDIALGIEISHDFRSGFSDTVIKKTVEIGGGLGISEEALRKWEAGRIISDNHRRKNIAESLTKLQNGPISGLAANQTLPWEIRPKTESN